MGNFTFIFSILVYEGKRKFPGFIIIRLIKYTFDTTFSTFNKNLEYYFCLVLKFHLYQFHFKRLKSVFSLD